MSTRRPVSRPGAQRGAVLIVSLLILVVMLISSVALVRSFDTTLSTAGNLAFKRDLAQQSERAAQEILTEFRTSGVLVSKAQRAADMPSKNYSAVVLPSNPQGIPTTLLGATMTFGTRVEPPPDANGISLQYVVDRLCSSTGDETALGRESCTMADNITLPGTDFTGLQSAERGSNVAAGGTGAGLAGAVPQPVIYRLTIRAKGPRDTQSFFQTNFTCCDD